MSCGRSNTSAASRTSAATLVSSTSSHAAWMASRRGAQTACARSDAHARRVKSACIVVISVHLRDALIAVHDIRAVGVLKAVRRIPVIAVLVLLHDMTAQHALLEGFALRSDKRQRGLPQLHEFVFKRLEQAEPHAALLAAIAPVTVYRRARALPLAGVEEPAATTAAVFVRCLVERAIALDAVPR